MLVRSSKTHRTLGSLAGGVALSVVGLGAFASTASAATPTGDPSTPAPVVCTGYDTDGFTVFVHGDATLGNSETEGSVALGGDLTLPDGSSGALIHSSGLTPEEYDLPTVDRDPTRLLVGGTLDLRSTGTLEVSSKGSTSADQIGAIKFGDTDGLALTPRSGVDRLHAAGGDENAGPYVDVNADAHQTLSDTHAVSYAGAPDVVTSRFPDLVAQGQSLQTISGDGVATATVKSDGADGVVTLTAGKLNVLTIDSATLSSFANLEFADVTPGADTGFVVNVTGSDYSVRIPPLVGTAMPSQPSDTDPNPWASFVTWNLTGAGTATVTGELITGTVLAPDVDLTTAADSPIEGQVIAKTLTTSGGEIHNYRTAQQCTDDSTPTPSPTPSPTTTTATPQPQPSPTDTTSAPTPSPTSTTTPSTAPTTSTPSSSSSPTDTTEVLATSVTASPATGSAATGDLATTGASMLPALIGGLLVAAGIALLVVRRRLARG